MDNKKTRVSCAFIAVQRSKAAYQSGHARHLCSVAVSLVFMSHLTRKRDSTRLHHHKVEVTAVTLSISL